MSTLACAALFLSVASHGQWLHRHLLSDPMGAFVDGNYVNPTGHYAITTGGPVYKDGQQLGGGAFGLAFGMNSGGQVVWAADEVYVDNTRLAGLRPGQREVYGITESGLAFFQIGKYRTVEADLYLGTQSLGIESVLGAHRTVHSTPFARALTNDGVPAWYGSGDATGQRSHAFLGLRDVSAEALGADSTANTNCVNGLGDLLWTGKLGGPTSNNRINAYVNDRNISAPVIGADRTGYGRYINNAGQVAWEGWPQGAVSPHVFLDGLDVSVAAYGDPSVIGGVFTRGLSEGGHVLWEGKSSADGYWTDVFSDTRNLTKTILGSSRYSSARGIDDLGRALWDGAGENVPTRRAFVDELDLALAAYGQVGSEYLSVGLAMDGSGDTLWAARRPGGETTDFWLSTPVPEPAAGWLLLALPMCRRSRLRRYLDLPAGSEQGMMKQLLTRFR